MRRKGELVDAELPDCTRRDNPTAQETPSVLVLRGAGAWVYFNADQIRRRFLELLE